MNQSPPYFCIGEMQSLSFVDPKSCLIILKDFKNATPGLNLSIFWIKNSIVMNLNALYSILYHKISLLSDKFNVLKTSSIEDRSFI